MAADGMRPDQTDPSELVRLPVVHALNGIILRAVIGFALVAGGATLPLIFEMEMPVHALFHLALPAGWVLYAAAVGAWLLLRRPPHEPHPWARAAEVDAGLTSFARRVSMVMVAGWIVSLGAVIVHHHLSSPRDMLVTFGIIVPLNLAAWILAVVAWSASSRASLARAELDAAELLRNYWSGLQRQ